MTDRSDDNRHLSLHDGGLNGCRAEVDGCWMRCTGLSALHVHRHDLLLHNLEQEQHRADANLPEPLSICVRARRVHKRKILSSCSGSDFYLITLLVDSLKHHRGFGKCKAS
jgi:hypothetical protein